MAPWTPGQFQKKSKKLGKKRAKKGAKIANAILKRGGHEGMAIATGMARAMGQPRLPRPKAGW
ncbi:MAG: hypothetical protein FD189_1097 [Elusimicrobia bacterium]|nr:MAG: hypothetical protein FD189_1097 [Elusimicrobiota bacterium]